ncbi:MAG TPA: L,D-transpeptidase [Polyangiaceae bacterium]|nr:L,D-transpeptidase [Polyangiaceae bacterium]
MTTARLSRYASARNLGLLAGLSLGALALSPGCKSNGVGLSKEQQGEDAFADVPSPPADGPKLVALREATPILDRPRPDARVIGELRLGAVVARSVEPYSRSGCEEGWYAVRPRGFVCVGSIATLAASAADVLPAGPDTTRPLPYRYGRARFESVATYSRQPTLAEQSAAEPDLGRHLPRSQGDGDPLGAAANDVPLDARGVPTGPPVLLPGGDGVDASSRRTTASFFTFTAGERIPPLVPLSVLRGEAPAPAPLKRGSGVAITGAFSADGGAAMRRFGFLPDGRVVPIDRLKPSLGSTWHGIDLEKVGLPVGFVHKRGVNTFALSRGKAEAQDEELDRRTAVPLTGRFRTVDGVRYEQAKEGYWLRSQDLIVVVRRSKFPEFAKGAQKWLDVSLANQTLTAYEGSKPVFATLISSGRDQLKDPQVSASTVRGTFRIQRKHVTRAVDNREVHGEFDVADAPWVMEFEPGYAMTGMYWSDGVGEAQGFHNIGMTPIDARRIFMWSDPEVPEGWHGVVDGGETSTIVFVRP